MSPLLVTLFTCRRWIIWAAVAALCAGGVFGFYRWAHRNGQEAGRVEALNAIEKFHQQQWAAEQSVIQAERRKLESLRSSVQTERKNLATARDQIQADLRQQYSSISERGERERYEALQTPSGELAARIRAELDKLCAGDRAAGLDCPR
jgi:hypothetical protein